jgi:hypothetical protein
MKNKKICITAASATLLLGLTGLTNVAAARSPLTEVPSVLSIPGTFTHPGLLGPGYLGKTIGMRTVITIRPKEHPTLDLYFTPPGRPERLVDRVVYVQRIG